MKITLTEQECQNVRVAIRALVKQPELNEDAMKQLLALSDKFVYGKEPDNLKTQNKKI